MKTMQVLHFLENNKQSYSKPHEGHKQRQEMRDQGFVFN